VDLAGGTLDIWPLGLLHPGARTVNLAIDVEVAVSMRRRGSGYCVHQGETRLEVETTEELAAHPEGALVGVVADALDLPPVEVELASGSPRGGGLGASSAMAVALIAAGQEILGPEARPEDRAPRRRARLARDLEARLMGLPTGMQDHYPALLGGALEIVHRPGGEEVRPLEVDLEALAASLLVVFTGVSHFSAGQNWEVVRRRLEGEPEARALFSGIAEVAAALPEALVSGDLARAGELVAREWSYRRHLAQGVDTPEIESLVTTARSLGAWGWKACGAGGGGSVAILCPPERRGSIAERLAQTGVEPLPARPSFQALRVEGGASPS
jgi:D-glycero-alpha-D-manno-heptose-7-phosphate kinase